MGGVSVSGFQVDPKGNEDGGPTGLFKGYLYAHFLRCPELRPCHTIMVA